MPTNVLNAESAILTGTARAKRFWSRFFQTWNAPAFDAVMVRWWDTLAPEAKAKARESYPEQLAEIEKKVEGLRDKGQER